MEASHEARERELEERAETLRKEALSAKLRESRALEDMAEAKQHLAEQRDRFSSTRQELTAEVSACAPLTLWPSPSDPGPHPGPRPGPHPQVIAYQRDLEKYYGIERTLLADLADVKSQLRAREEFMEGFDTKVAGFLVEKELSAFAKVAAPR